MTVINEKRVADCTEDRKLLLPFRLMSSKRHFFLAFLKGEKESDEKALHREKQFLEDKAKSGYKSFMLPNPPFHFSHASLPTKRPKLPSFRLTPRARDVNAV